MQHFTRINFRKKPPNIDLSRKVHYEENYVAQQVFKLVVHHQKKSTAYNLIRSTISKVTYGIIKLKLTHFYVRIFFIFYD
jgi:hypothetical protein